MKIAIAGAGYVGLANALLLAQKNEVTILDVVQEKVRLLNERKSPIKDPEIDDYIKRVDFHATLDAREAFTGAAYIIVAAPTDYDPAKNFFNTSAVEDVLDNVKKYAPDAIAVIKSTIPVGYTESMRRRYDTGNIIFAPEFLREGRALYDNLYPSRIVIGDETERGERFAALLREGALKKDISVIYAKPTEAEAMKLFANTYLALRVAYFNELDSYASVHGLDTAKIISGISLDPRIGDFYNNPSFGYGGYCLPKDTKQLLANYDGVPQNLIAAVVESNRTRKSFIANDILEKKPEIVGIWRLTMKTGSDNFRLSAVQGLIRRIREKGGRCIIYEPRLADDSFMGFPVIKSPEEFKRKSSIIVANRWSDELSDVAEKVYTRDIFKRD